jgi:RNA polymerase primary sigma factor
MSDKIIFREMLSEISEFARANHNKLTREEINKFFEKVSLSEEHMELIYSYLEANKIEVEGHVKNENSVLFETQESSEAEDSEATQDPMEPSVSEEDNSEENAYLKLYLDELRTLPDLQDSEKRNLFQRAMSRDSSAKNQLIEIYLLKVVEIAKRYVNHGVLISDLIQEGNIGLMMGANQLDTIDDVEQVDEILQTSIIEAIESVLEENELIDIAKKQMVRKVNFLNEGVKNLEEELGRTVSILELANYLEMSEEEVADIIRVSDDEIKVEENENKKN